MLYDLFESGWGHVFYFKLVNPVRELRPFTPLERDFLTGRAVCADPVRCLLSNGADGGIGPPSALR